MIPARNLSLLSNRLARAGTRIPETVLERDYCLAWFLVALSRAPLRERLIFKGGTALKRCYFGSYRFSEDLDFTLSGESDFETIRKELEAVFAEARRAAGMVIRFAREDRRRHENSHTFYLAYEGPFPGPAGGREVKVDVTIRERVIFPVEDRPILRGYKEYTDLAEGAKVRAYSLQEIACEKVVAVMDPARNEPRDLYDLWYLATGGHVRLSDLAQAVARKWDFRGRKLDDVRGEFLAKQGRYRKLWEPRLGGQISDMPEFTGVYRAVHRALRRAGLVGK